VIFMARNKEEDKKEFLISTREKIGPGLTNAPVWILQKAGKRIWNRKQHRNWRETDLGELYKKKKKEQGKVKNTGSKKSGKHKHKKWTSERK
jgi:ribosomal protein L39E